MPLHEQIEFGFEIDQAGIALDSEERAFASEIKEEKVVCVRVRRSRSSIIGFAMRINELVEKWLEVEAVRI